MVDEVDVMSSSDNEFSDQQLLRYSRQIMLPSFGIESQQVLHDAHIAIIGIGGLGSPAALYLCASGVGRLTLVDFDTVEASNLQRQIIHNDAEQGNNKAESAARSLQRLNPDTDVHCIDRKLDEPGLLELCAQVDCVIDATDNFTSRFMINTACVKSRTALVSAAAIRYEGQISVFDLRQENSACYACLYPELDPAQGEQETTCAENGILAPVVGILGSMQALESIKLLCGIGEPLVNRLLLFDALALQWRTMRLRKDNDCPVCGKKQDQQVISC